MPTEYTQAWEAYKASPEHKRSEGAMLEKGMKQPYIDNILQSAFECGWNNKPKPQDADMA